MSGKRIVRSFTTQLSSAPNRIFPLLCPKREYDWIPFWTGKIQYSTSGFAELGCVFTTDNTDPFGPETWVVCTYEMDRLIGFVKTGLHTATRFNVSLEPDQCGTIIRWEQEITSLDEYGDHLLGEITTGQYEDKMKGINTLLEHYLVHGKPKIDHESNHR